MPVAIVGSGRCGTSMITGMLSHCGLYVGEKNALLTADERNPRGYWEHVGMREMTDRVLGHLDELYGNAALAPAGWHHNPALEPLYDDARIIVESLASRPIWGWKYPQTSLVIPFWREVVPDLRFVLCMRNPLDAISSFAASFAYTRPHAGELWLLHALKVLIETEPEQRFVTYYEEYFPDYRKGLMPLLDYLGLPNPPKGSATDRAITDFHRVGLNHYHSSAEDLLTSGEASYLMRELYVQLLSSDRHATNIPILAHAEIYMPLLAKLYTADTNEHHVRHLQNVLSSRTHRMASALCSLLIRLRPKKKASLLASESSRSHGPVKKWCAAEQAE
ncbi:MAG TPA: sulfotransferase [Capsulimonadaceae bacterium]|nr:sulfotransferase [Capsulimonadaceae bacterium]